MKTKTRRVLTAVILILLFSILAFVGWLIYDNNVDRSGWVEKDGIRYYRDFHADPVSGWLDIDGQRYFFNDDGTPCTGWLFENATYYLGDDGVMALGWQTIGENTYYFGTDGVMHSGWLELDGLRYYLPDGILVKGWQELDGKRLYFGEDGAMKTGFTKVEGSIYYFDDDGTPLTGLVTIDDRRFYFSDEGVMHTGWLDWEEGRSYCHIDGSMATGWQELDGKRYYFDKSGILQSGWLQEGEYTYYLQEDGSAAVGPAFIDGATHYFSPKGIEVILVNRSHPVPSYYERNLVTVVDWHQVDQRCYDALVQMLADCNAAGIEYIFNSAYRTIEEQTEILEARTAEHMENFDLDYDAARKKALQTVAVPGTSEHHLGLAVDLLGEEAIAWLQEHCWEYGFILRYTQEKEPITGIIDEPWHFRYVGKEVSMDMKDSGLCLEEYLGAA